MTLAPARRSRTAAGQVAIALVVGLAAAGLVSIGSAGAQAGASGRSSCPPTAAVREASGPGADAVAAQEAREGRPAVELVQYPRPDTPGNPWSQWGQGLVLDDGRFLSALGNHLGKDGNAYLYVYEPARNRLTQFADVRSAAGDALGWGYGKVHGQVVRGPCGDAYVATYWGTRTGLTYSDRYRGDLLLRIDGSSLALTSQGAPVDGRGIPSLAGTVDGSLLYGEGVDPAASAKAGRDVGTFFAYDPVQGKVVFTRDVAEHAGFRNVLVDARGDAYVAATGGRLLRYTRASSTLTSTDLTLPGGGWLRASTAPAPDGTVYGVTTQPDRFFALRADGTIDDLGPAPGYTASVALAPDGSRMYLVPNAHGDGVAQGTPLLAVDTTTGARTELARLDDLTRTTLGLRAGGSYGVAVDPDGSRLYVGLNAGATAEKPWGEVVLAVVHLGEGTAAPRTPSTQPKSKSNPSKSKSTEKSKSKSSKSEQAKGKSKSKDKSKSKATSSEAAAAVACRSEQATTAGYRAVAAGTSGALRLDDATATWGAEEPLAGMRAHALATGDVNGDGWTDVFVGTFADRPAAEYRQRGATGPAPDRLLLGGPDGFRADPTFPEARGRTSGAAFGDLDGDGDLDLVVARNVRPDSAVGRLPTTVYRNDDGRFVEATTLPEPAGGRSVGLLDYDGDGALDLFIGEDRFAGGSSVLLRNTGGLAFTDVTEAAGIPRGVAGMGIGTADLNGDGRPDLFVGGANRLFLNQGGGRFAEQAGAVAKWATHGAEDDAAGVAVGDVNGDGRPDVVVGQHYNSTLDAAQRVPIRLYLNEPTERGGMQLRDVTDAAGLVGLATKSPHVEIADLDADGRPDIVTSAAGGDGRQPIVFRNEGTEGGVPRFTASAATGSRQYWVTGATFDADHDGRLDVVVAEWEPSLPTRFLRNVGDTGHWLGVRGTPGTTVEAFAAGGLGDAAARRASATIGTSTGYSAGPPDEVWLGVGDHERLDVRITPPGGRPVELRNVRVDQQLGCRA